MFNDNQFAGWMAQKYGILGMHGQAAVDQGHAALTAADAAQQQAAAAQRRAEAEAQQAAAQAAYLNAQAGQVAPNAESERALRGSQGNVFNEEATKQHQLNQIMPGFLQKYLGGRMGIPEIGGGQPTLDDLADPYHFSRGTADVPASPQERAHFHGLLKAMNGANRVPGKGSGNVDTVPAMLAPGEAVLNKHAAELIGRDKIAAANAIGVAKQEQEGVGMAAPKGGGRRYAGGAQNVPGYADGTSDIMGAPMGAAPSPQYMTPDEMRDSNALSAMYASMGKRDPNADADWAQRYNGRVTANGFSKGTANVKPQKLAGGTHMVGHGKSAKTPTKLDPQAVMGLLGALSGGAGAASAPPPRPGGMVYGP
jgi:hypothetical protein